jgi:hypothetical protein
LLRQQSVSLGNLPAQFLLGEVPVVHRFRAGDPSAIGKLEQDGLLECRRVVRDGALQSGQVDLDHAATIGLDSLGFDAPDRMGDPNLDQQVACLVLGESIGLVGSQPDFEIDLAEGDLPGREIDLSALMDLAAVIPRDRGVWHVQEIATPGGQHQRLPLRNDLLGPQVNPGFIPSLAAGTTQMSEMWSLLSAGQ